MSQRNHNKYKNLTKKLRTKFGTQAFIDTAKVVQNCETGIKKTYNAKCDGDRIAGIDNVVNSFFRCASNIVNKEFYFNDDLDWLYDNYASLIDAGISKNAGSLTLSSRLVQRDSNSQIYWELDIRSEEDSMSRVLEMYATEAKRGNTNIDYNAEVFGGNYARWRGINHNAVMFNKVLVDFPLDDDNKIEKKEKNKDTYRDASRLI
ncbi:hypothetical protein HQ545_00825 [Candidatus Woesearchaeota archaeon]|nr:hypothetical protein [Candidatus Woesearchaeota archaeon]